MLEAFLVDLALHDAGAPLDLRATLSGFDAWLSVQKVDHEDVPYLAARLAAYVSVFLQDYYSAEQVVLSGRLVLRVPLASGVVREFDAYKLAYEAARSMPCDFRSLLEALTQS